MMSSFAFGIVPLFLLLFLGFGIALFFQKNSTLTVHKLYLFFVSIISIFAFLGIFQEFLQSEISYIVIDEATYVSQKNYHYSHDCSSINDCSAQSKQTLASREYTRKSTLAVFCSWGLLWLFAFLSHFPLLVQKELEDEKKTDANQ